MPNIAEVLNQASEILRQSGVAQPRREAHSLLALALERDKTFLIAYPEYELNDLESERFQGLLARRAEREPLQYIRGIQEFYGLDFEVNSDVLIPRPETEMIVENAIEILKDFEKPRFCEVGTGSGCVSVSILNNVPNATAVGLDVSDGALKMTRQNAERHQVAERLHLITSDVFSALLETEFDLIVSNPPYISSEDFGGLQIEVRDFEPQLALTDNQNGLSIIKKIVTNSSNFLHPNGFLLMEIGFDQSEDVRKMFADELWQTVEIQPDLQGIPRMVRAQLS